MDVGLAEAEAELEIQLREHFDFEAGTASVELLEEIAIEHPALGPFHGHDVGGTGGTVEEGHFPKAHPGGEDIEALGALAFVGETDFHLAGDENEQLIGHAAGLDNGLPFRKGPERHPFGQEPEVIPIATGEKRTAIQGDGLLLFPRTRHDHTKEFVFAGFEGGVIAIIERFFGNSDGFEGVGELPGMAAEKADPDGAELLLDFPEHAQADIVRTDHVAEVEDHILAGTGLFDELTDHGLERGEEQRTVQLKHTDPLPVLIEHLEGGGRQATPGDDLSGVVGLPEGRLMNGARVEEVQRQLVGQVHADADPADAVSLGIEQRRKDPDPELPREHGQNAAGHAALRRKADPIDPFPGPIVHPASGHDAEDVVHVGVSNGALPGDGVDALVGQGRSHDREIGAGDPKGALLKVTFQGVIRILIQNPKVPQHPTDGPIAVAGFALGMVHILVDRKVASGARGKVICDPLDPAGTGAGNDLAGHGDGAGIDHGVERRPAALAQTDGIEGIARRLDSDFGKDVLFAPIFQGKAIDQRLGDGLDRERKPGVPDFIEIPVPGGDADAEGIGIGLGQLRDVIGQLSVEKRGVASVESF